MSQELQAVLVARLRAIPDGDVSATARRAGIALRQLMRLRRGENTDVRLSMLERLAKGMGVSIGGLLGVGDEPPPPRAVRQTDERALRRLSKHLHAAGAEVQKLIAAEED